MKMIKLLFQDVYNCCPLRWIILDRDNIRMVGPAIGGDGGLLCSPGGKWLECCSSGNVDYDSSSGGGVGGSSSNRVRQTRPREQ